MNFIALAYLFIVLVIDLATDYKLFLSQKDVKHKRGAWIRTAALIPCIALFAWDHPRINVMPAAIGVVVCICFMVAFTWVLFFDGVFNKLRKDPFFKTHNKPGTFDGFWHSIGVGLSATIKIVGFIASHICYWATYYS